MRIINRGKALLLLILGGLSTAVPAEVITGPALEMARVGALMRSIYPTIIDPGKKLTPEQTAQLQQDLDALSTHVNNTSKQKILQTDTFKLAMKTLLKHLESAQKSIRDNDTHYARSLLRSATTLCSACHTQDFQKRIFTKESLKVTFANPLYEADYYYMTRNYSEAQDIYQHYIAGLRQLTWTEESKTALERILVIFIQINRDPTLAESYLDALKASPKVDKVVKARIEKWLDGLQTVKTEEQQATQQKFEYKTLAQDMEKYILPGDDMFIVLPENKRVIALWMRGMLHRHLNTFPTAEETPQILYWLAFIDRSLEYNLFYSLADLYLKQCITGYPSHPYADKCFNLYKDYIYFSYTGSAGTHVPESVQEELRELQAQLKTSPKATNEKQPKNN